MSNTPVVSDVDDVAASEPAPIRRIVLLFLAFALVSVWGLLAYDLRSQRERITTQSREELVAQAIALAGGTRAAIHRIDAVLYALALQWKFDRTGFPEAIKANQARLGDLTLQVSVIDKAGNLAYSTLTPAAGDVYLGDRKHFRVHSNAGTDRLYISSPVLGRISGKWSIQMTRRLESQAGFDGVIVVSVDPTYFAHVRERTQLDRDDFFTILRTSGEVIFRSLDAAPRPDFRVTGRPYVGSDAPVSGTRQGLSQVDGVARTIAWRRVPDFDLVVIVGESLSRVEARATDGRETRLALAFVASLMIIGFAVVVLRSAGALARSEARFVRFFRMSPTAHVLTRSRDRKYVAINKAFERLFGVTEAGAVGKTSLELGFWADPDDREAFIESVLAKGECDAFETRLRTADGREFDARQSSVLLDVFGEPHLLSTIIDISDEIELRGLNARVTAIVGAAMDAIVTCDSDGRIVVFNEAAERMFGVGRDAALGTTIDRFLPTRIAEAHAEHMRQFARTRSASRAMGTPGNVVAVRSNGEEFPVEASISQVRAAGEQLFTVILRDIGARLRSERRIERLTSLYSALVKSGEAIVRNDDWAALCVEVCRVIVEFARVQTAVIRMPGTNRAGLAVFAAHGVLAGRMGRETVPMSEIDNPLVSAFRHGTQHLIRDILEEPGLRRSYDTARQLNMRSTVIVPIRDGESIIGTLAVIAAEVGHFDEEFARLIANLAEELGYAYRKLSNDAAIRESERRIRALNATLEGRIAERTAELTAANQSLLESNRDLEAFSYSVAHDLRAPLRSMEGFARLFELDVAAGNFDDVSAHISRIVTSAARMDALIDGLLSVARVAHEALKEEDIDFSALVAEVLREIEIPDHARIEVGPCPRVRGDRVLLRQVWSNLIANAVKFSAKSEAPSISIGCELDARSAVFFVGDNGVGFDAANSGKLFEVFQRLHARTEFEGHGVGLAIVRRIVERHGGRIWAESVAGQGATFRFVLAHSRLLPQEG